MPKHRALSTLALLLLLAPAARADTVLTLATIAPEGSGWMKLFHAFDREVQDRTGGQVKVKFFPGGIQGDEKDVVRKMRGGALDAAALTAVGLGQISPHVRVLELPLLFQSDAEVDYVRGQMEPELEGSIDAGGFKLLSWGDVGWVYWWSNLPLTSAPALERVKMWAWTDDAIVHDLFEKVNMRSVSLGEPDVYTSLETGLIDACYGPPLAVLALQWYTKVKYVTAQPISMATGAVVMSKEAWARLTPDQEAAVTVAAGHLQGQFVAQIRRENAAALKILQRHGIQVVPLPEDVVKLVTARAQKVWIDLEGALYPKSVLSRATQLLFDYRQRGAGR